MFHVHGLSLVWGFAFEVTFSVFVLLLSLSGTWCYGNAYDDFWLKFCCYIAYFWRCTMFYVHMYDGASNFNTFTQNNNRRNNLWLAPRSVSWRQQKLVDEIGCTEDIYGMVHWRKLQYLSQKLKTKVLRYLFLRWIHPEIIFNRH